MADRIGKQFTQRQLRVGEMIKQSLSMIFIRNEAKIPNLETNNITVTEVRMSQDLKIAKAYVLPLGGKDADKTIEKFAEEGIDQLAVVTPAFVSDCLETLEEIGMEGKEEFIEAGGTDFYAVPCINDNDDWVDVLVNWIHE